MDYVYIVECTDNTLYTGYTNDPARRIEEHNLGVGAKYTRGRGPVELVYLEEFADKSEAMKREYEIKQFSKSEKLELIRKGTVK